MTLLFFFPNPVPTFPDPGVSCSKCIQLISPVPVHPTWQGNMVPPREAWRTVTSVSPCSHFEGLEQTHHLPGLPVFYSTHTASKKRKDGSTRPGFESIKLMQKTPKLQLAWYRASLESCLHSFQTALGGVLGNLLGSDLRFH